MELWRYHAGTVRTVTGQTELLVFSFKFPMPVDGEDDMKEVLKKSSLIVSFSVIHLEKSHL